MYILPLCEVWSKYKTSQFYIYNIFYFAKKTRPIMRGKG